MNAQPAFNGNGTSEMPKLQRLTGRKEYPLSLNQQHMWFQCQLDLESSLWNLGTRITVLGPLDVGIFVRAIQSTVDRHEILRTVFVLSDDIPVQRVIDKITVDCPVQDLPAGLSQKERERAAWTLMSELADPAYDLSASPLFRAKLLRASPEQHYFMFAFHHLLLDAFYCGQLMKEIVSAYDQLCRGEIVAEKPNLQYGDFCAWQQERWENGLMAQTIEFWREQLREPIPQLVLPSDPTVPFPRVVKSQLSLHLDAEIAGKLRDLGRQARTTIFRVMLAAFTLLFTRYSDSSEVMFDIDFSTRPREMGHTMGFFANLLPVRLQVQGGESFRDFLRLVDSQLRNVTTHREFPIRQLARKLRKPGQSMRPMSPVVVTQLGVFDWSLGALNLSGTMYVTASIHDVWLAVLERQDDLEIIVAYSDELFDRSQAREWAAWLERMIHLVIANPDVPLSQLTRPDEDQEDSFWQMDGVRNKSGRERVERVAVIKNT